MALLLKKNKQKEVDIIKDIHLAFDSAEDALYQEALTIIQNCDQSNLDKADRLEKLGFVKSKTVIAARDTKQKLVESQALAQLIAEYKITYPMCKFITEDELAKICDKYGLIFAPIANFTGDVPKKNLKDIESMPKLNLKHDVSKLYRFTILRNKRTIDSYQLYDWLENNEFPVSLRDLNYAFRSEYGRFHKNGKYLSLYEHLITLGMNQHLAQSLDNHQENFKEDGFVTSTFGSTETVVDKSGLFIAAPKSDFDLKDLTKDSKTKHGFFHMVKTVMEPEIKDPIVFRYIRGGIQIITKWGLEGDDPLFFEPKEN